MMEGTLFSFVRYVPFALSFLIFPIHSLFLSPYPIQDSPSGILAAKASACHVVAVATTHTIQSLLDAGADWVVEDLRGVRILGKTKEEEDRWEVEIGPCWVEVDEGKGKEEKHK